MKRIILSLIIMLLISFSFFSYAEEGTECSFEDLYQIYDSIQWKLEEKMSGLSLIEKYGPENETELEKIKFYNNLTDDILDEISNDYKIKRDDDIIVSGYVKDIILISNKDDLGQYDSTRNGGTRIVLSSDYFGEDLWGNKNINIRTFDDLSFLKKGEYVTFKGVFLKSAFSNDKDCLYNSHLIRLNEILFRDIPWGSNLIDVKTKLPEADLFSIAGEDYLCPSVDGILKNDSYAGIDFEYSDINIISSAYDPDIQVAGYEVKELNLYFSYTEKDGVLSKKEKDSALYGATYIFDAKNLTEMTNDLVEKISSLYGYPYNIFTENSLFSEKKMFYHWKGDNGTELMLVSEDVSEDMKEYLSDNISISYAWRTGDMLLEIASNYEKEKALESEAQAYGNNDVSGL